MSIKDTSPTETTTTDAGGLTRRAFFAAAAAGAGASLLAGGVGSALAGEHDSHAHHATGHNTALAAAALDCVGNGNVCIEHCIARLRDGDTSMADCAAAVQAMNAACTGLARLAALDSAHLPKYAAACLAICEDCEKECRKHESHHAICKACADSCKTCIAECRKIAA